MMKEKEAIHQRCVPMIRVMQRWAITHLTHLMLILMASVRHLTMVLQNSEKRAQHLPHRLNIKTLSIYQDL